MGTYITIVAVILLGLFGISQFTQPPTDIEPEPITDYVVPVERPTTTVVPTSVAPTVTPAPTTATPAKPAAKPTTSTGSGSQTTTVKPATQTTSDTQTQTQTQTQTSTPPPATPHAATAAPASVSVAIRNFAFDAKTISVKKGTTVTWTNFDSAGHTVTGDSGGPSSGLLRINESFSYKFDTVGSFPYHCAPHPGMQGTVTVTE